MRVCARNSFFLFVLRERRVVFKDKKYQLEVTQPQAPTPALSHLGEGDKNKSVRVPCRIA